MKTAILTLFAVALIGCKPGAAVYYEAGQYRHSAVGYEVGRALLPGALCFIGSAMYNKTDRARGVQVAIYTGAFVSLGAFGEKRKAKDYLIGMGACGIGLGLGAAYKRATE
ncbi:MAG: hypothetical protein KDC70_00245 [Saprospiraceae bacterium]|nr:hypothetical protein [Saprospiraceae bacterium]